MNTKSDQQTILNVPFPFGEEQVFRYRAMEDILVLLIRNPFRELTVRQLRELTDNGTKTTTRAVELLAQLSLVRVDTGGRSKDVSLNREQVTIPEDPYFSIPQDEFRTPIRTFVERARDEVPGFSALLVFGSVARGEADRRSDIDIWILVEDSDQLLQARRTATGIGSELEEERFPVQRATEPQPREERYNFEVLVEAVDTAGSYAEDVSEILTEGIVIVDSERLQEVKDVVLQGKEDVTDE
ncbi:nucleotidyltransferase domain-containing protein [Halostella salina]|uniref:nucleotidyltransferase domain-containing protein n=1 Tax=Halostella salina TaxID=1547897 RepID=UPI000EF79AE6|nr:nucleotidyltransferase domain-containing protein [Halostella salina]